MAPVIYTLLEVLGIFLAIGKYFIIFVKYCKLEAGIIITAMDDHKKSKEKLLGAPMRFSVCNLVLLLLFGKNSGLLPCILTA